MKMDNDDRAGIFLRAWKIIDKDSTIPSAEKEWILKLIKALLEAAEATPARTGKNDRVKTFTQEIISKHSLMSLVKQQADELDALKRLSLNLTSSLDLQTVLDSVVSEAMRLVKNSRAAHIFVYRNERVEFGASLNVDGARNKPLSKPRPAGLTHTVASQGQMIIVEDIGDHPIYRGAPREWKGSIIGIPLLFNKSIVGVMNLSRSIVGKFTTAEIRLLSLLADQAAVAISNASMHQQVTEQANTDAVTGLPNRRALDERLQEDIRLAKQNNSQCSVVMMDLDRFKAVNDTHGHGVGDEVLHSAFNYLARSMRAGDFLARYGGDELTLIMKDSDLESAIAVTRKIIDLIAAYSYRIPGDHPPITLGITAGIATYPLHSITAGDLLRAADSALYFAKKHHRGSYAIALKTTGPLDSVPVTRKLVSPD